MAKFVDKKPKAVASETKGTDKKKQFKPNKPGKEAALAQVKKLAKIPNGASPQKQKNNEKKKKDRKALSLEADENEENISSEVGQLLNRLRQEHGLPEDANISAGDVTSPVKKDKAVKNKGKGAQPVVQKVAEKGKSAKVAPKQKNKKRSLEADSVDVAEQSPDKVPKLNNGQKAGKKENLTNKGKKNNSKESPANLAKPTDNQNSPKKNKKKNKKPQEDAEKSLVDVSKPNEGQKVGKKVKKQEKGKNEPAAPKETAESNKPNEDKDKLKKKKKKEKQTKSKAEKVDFDTLKNVSQEEAHELEEKSLRKFADSTKVYVGNLPLNVKRKQIVNKFCRYGKILAVHIRNNCGKRIHVAKTYKKALPKNTPFLIAFVFFENADKARASVELNGTTIGDNTIKVELHEKNNNLEDGKPKHHPQRTIFVGSLQFGTTETQLREAFECCGQIDYIRVLQGERGCKGTAFICFQEPEAVSLALKLDKTLILGREIHLERYHSKKLGAGKKSKVSLTGAERRLAIKDGVKKETGNKKVRGGFGKEDSSKKKSKDFLGAKTNKKKPLKKQQKKGIKGLKLLAKKVAPKAVKSSDAVKAE